MKKPNLMWYHPKIQTEILIIKYLIGCRRIANSKKLTTTQKIRCFWLNTFLFRKIDWLVNKTWLAYSCLKALQNYIHFSLFYLFLFFCVSFLIFKFFCASRFIFVFFKKCNVFFCVCRSLITVLNQSRARLLSHKVYLVIISKTI